MLTLKSRLRPNVEEVAAKVIDGEAVLINLSNGVYYSMDEVGALIWEMVESKYSLEEMVATICARYDVSTEQTQSDVERLAAELLDENLLSVADETTSKEEIESQGNAPTNAAYASPQLNVYRDMGDLLALDPPTPGLELTPWQDSEEAPSQGESQ